ncbi:MULTISPECIES: hypothetical protein [Bradyrhizobium]|uniref:Uncharacterized protein n=1 Tax=Bradyrhizobium diversitatis TaxID=2755406 RepID=A0ABS0P0D2_9BRAD|nr:MULTISPECIES: hypothetical protein [Bradyrhizobium]KYK47608.1 hypothetical protein A1D31_29750 [Bradyrhizobium liaoningense]MBH5386728.1 hypothetical protein [Bradyrhizobium diversitatis]UPJ68832.1 hypothetical protein IVB23_17150 [Bradyrhizobium sp. 191]
MELAIGLGMLVIAIVLIYAGLPDKQGGSPRFLRFHAASVLYPPLILVFIALGTAQVVFSFD